MVTKTFTVLTVRATLWSATVMPPMASSCIAAVPVDGKAVRIPLPTPIKNVAVSKVLPAPLASLAPPCPHGSKIAQLSPLYITLLAPDPEDPTSMTLELGELWSFVLKKANDSWIWIALCRQTRQVVVYTLGDRSKKTCQRLWEAIPEGYRRGHCFTDF